MPVSWCVVTKGVRLDSVITWLITMPFCALQETYLSIDHDHSSVQYLLQWFLGYGIYSCNWHGQTVERPRCVYQWGRWLHENTNTSDPGAGPFIILTATFLPSLAYPSSILAEIPASMSHLRESDRVSLIERRRETVLHLLSHSVKTDARKYTCYIFPLLHVLFITQGNRRNRLIIT